MYLSQWTWLKKLFNFQKIQLIVWRVWSSKRKTLLLNLWWKQIGFWILLLGVLYTLYVTSTIIVMANHISSNVQLLRCTFKDKTVISREQEAIAKRTKALQEKLQTLVKSAAPLKQIMNYVQEDVDTMHKELHFWTAEIGKNNQMLLREKQLVVECKADVMIERSRFRDEYCVHWCQIITSFSSTDL